MELFAKTIIGCDYKISLKPVSGEQRIGRLEIAADRLKVAIKNIDHLLVRGIADAGPDQQQILRSLM